MSLPPAQPVVHLELRTPNLPRACAFYTRLFGWTAETLKAGSGAYLVLALGHGLQGGVAELEGVQPAWVPYVEVPDIAAATERGERLGGAVLLGPREGAAGWRSILEVPDGGQVALWQPKL